MGSFSGLRVLIGPCSLCRLWLECTDTDEFMTLDRQCIFTVDAAVSAWLSAVPEAPASIRWGMLFSAPTGEPLRSWGITIHPTEGKRLKFFSMVTPLKVSGTTSAKQAHL